MIETHTDNNRASAIFRLTGNDVEILEIWSQAIVVGLIGRGPLAIWRTMAAVVVPWSSRQDAATPRRRAGA